MVEDPNFRLVISFITAAALSYILSRRLVSRAFDCWMGIAFLTFVPTIILVVSAALAWLLHGDVQFFAAALVKFGSQTFFGPAFVLGFAAGAVPNFWRAFRARRLARNRTRRV
jgi:hypothetical protein